MSARKTAGKPARHAAEPLPSLEALRTQLSAPGAVLTDALRSAMARDPRKGVQQLLAALDARAAKAQAELDRQERMLRYERPLWAAGTLHVAGVDEVGVGPLAGPAMAAAVILPRDFRLAGLNDSKQVLDPAAREALAAEVRASAIAYCIARGEVDEIDRLNIRGATLLAMRRAVNGLVIQAQHLLVDAHRIPELSMPQTPIIKGDALSSSIAAASVIAKVARDALMAELDGRYPGWGFAEHAGYPTPTHLAALRERAPSPVHRTSFAPVRASLERFGPPRRDGSW